MTKREFEVLGVNLASHMSGYVASGSMVIATPIEGLLKGLCFEGSSFDKKSFYLWVFFIPLCVPSEYLNFNLGRRLGDRWDASLPSVAHDILKEVQNFALPLLASVNTLDEIPNAVRSLGVYPNDLHVRQGVAYSLARCGRTSEALKALQELLSLFDNNVPWQRKMCLRAEDLILTLETSPSETIERLKAWELESIKSLKLERFI